jgi:hypothetical protein
MATLLFVFGVAAAIYGYFDGVSKIETATDFGSR